MGRHTAKRGRGDGFLFVLYVAIFIVFLYGGKVACCCMHARPSCQFLLALLPYVLFLTGYQVGGRHDGATRQHLVFAWT